MMVPRTKLVRMNTLLHCMKPVHCKNYMMIPAAYKQQLLIPNRIEALCKSMMALRPLFLRARCSWGTGNCMTKQVLYMTKKKSYKMMTVYCKMTKGNYMMRMVDCKRKKVDYRTVTVFHMYPLVDFHMYLLLHKLDLVSFLVFYMKELEHCMKEFSRVSCMMKWKSYTRVSSFQVSCTIGQEHCKMSQNHKNCYLSFHKGSHQKAHKSLKLKCNGLMSVRIFLKAKKLEQLSWIR